MGVEIVTKEDLHVFRLQLLNDIKAILKEQKVPSNEPMEGFKTSQVKKMLGCCTNKLISLRVARKIRTKKIGGTIYYNKEDIKRLLEEGY